MHGTVCQVLQYVPGARVHIARSRGTELGSLVGTATFRIPGVGTPVVVYMVDAAFTGHDRGHAIRKADVWKKALHDLPGDAVIVANVGLHLKTASHLRSVVSPSSSP